MRTRRNRGLGRVSLLAGITAVVLANLVVYAVYRAVHKPAAPAAQLEGSAPSKERAGSDLGLARAHRVAGLAALEEGDYAAAVKEFSQALRKGEEGGDTAELLRIAKDLQDRQRRRPAESPFISVEPRAPARAPSPPVAPPQAAKAISRPKPPPPPARKPAEAKAVEAEPARGLLLVTSTPSGLVVEVDGRRVDLTPARVSVDAGSHAVVLSRGDLRLYERTIEVDEGGVHSVDADLTEKLRPAAPPIEPQVKPAVPAASALPLEAMEPAPPPEPRPVAEASRASEPAPEAPSGRTGELQILSLNVYGEVWINDRPYGHPPLVAKGLPAGPARVEIRVQGVVRRSKVAEVVPNRRSTLRIR